MHSNCIKNLLDLKDVFIKSVKNFNNSVEIHAKLPISEQICPCCGSKTSKIHDHYIQPIKDSPIYFKPTTVFLKKTRYECKNCSKIFYPDNTKKFPKEQLDNEKYLVTDLWESYKDIGITYFRKAKIVSDHFHLARYACNALDKIRIQTQSKLPKSERKYFKHSRKLLLSRKCNINEDKYDELNNMLINYSEDLRIAYREKECLLDILHSEDCSDNRKKQFTEWVKRNLESPVPQLVECAKTYQHWSYEIKNSLEVPYSNGAIEGTNNKIKSLKRTTFGMPNFTNFKARIMLLN